MRQSTYGNSSLFSQRVTGATIETPLMPSIPITPYGHYLQLLNMTLEAKF